MVYYRILNIVPYALQSDLLFTHSVYNSLHLLIPNFQSIPSPPTTPWPPQVCSLCLSLFLFHRYILLEALFSFTILYIFLKIIYLP